MADRLQDALFDFILSLAARLQLAFGDEQRMVSTFDDVQFICRCHFSSNGLQDAQAEAIQFSRVFPSLFFLVSIRVILWMTSTLCWK